MFCGLIFEEADKNVGNIPTNDRKELNQESRKRTKNKTAKICTS